MKSTMKNMLLSLTLIAGAMGAVLAWVHSLTVDEISESIARAKIEALTEVLPEFDNDPSATEQEMELDGIPTNIYSATLNGEKSGTAVETGTLDGFSGEIRVMVGFDAIGAVTGYRILQHTETPGLGAKADSWFCDPTGNRSIIGTNGDLKVSKDGGEIDGITAATITSRAFLDAVNRARRAIGNEK